jgi:hypothetical protein
LEQLEGELFYNPDIIIGDENAEDINDLIEESELLYTNFIKSEALNTLKRNINTEILFAEFPELKACCESEDAKLVDVYEILEYQKASDASTIYEYSLREWVDETIHSIQTSILHEKFKLEKAHYDLDFILEKYKERVEVVREKEPFVKGIEEQLKALNENVYFESISFFRAVEKFINDYIKEEQKKFGLEEFLQKYGSEKYTIHLTDFKKKMFEDDIINPQLSPEEQKEYEAYKELKTIFASVAYVKGGKRLKPGLIVGKQFVENMEKMRDEALNSGFLSWDGEEYQVASMKKINAFAKRIP